MSGMIFVALAVVWAVYLIPRAVNRSEDELALLPTGWGEPEAPKSSGTKAARETAGDDARVPPGAGVDEAAVRTGVVRRRRVLLALLGVTVVTGVVALLTPLAVWSVVVPGALAIIWLVVCRVQVGRLEERRAQRRAAALEAEVVDHPQPHVEHDLGSGVVVDPATQRTFRIQVPDSPAALVVEPDEDTVGLSLADRAAALAEEMPRGAVWDPRPLTLPTYIAKPRARRVPRTLALDGVGVSSSGRDARDSALVAEGAYAGVDATARPKQAVGS